MTKNRLKLDFTLITTEERKAFLNKYLPTLTFTPSNHELECLGSYLLWGKGEDGLNSQQRGDCILKEWDTTSTARHETSLEALLEEPSFNENDIRSSSDPPSKVPHIKLNRELIRSTAPSNYLKLFEDLWRRIDEIDLIIESYELQNGLRTKEIRPELLNRIDDATLMAAEARAGSISQATYLKLRHQLVEMRREQYILKDGYSSPRKKTTLSIFSPSEILDFNSTILVLPLGLKSQTPTSFREQVWTWPIQPNLTKDLKGLSSYIWKKNSEVEKKSERNFYFDFRNPEHLYNAFVQYFNLEDAAASSKLFNPESSLPAFFETLKFYAEAADLNSIQRRIFELKLQHKTNAEIQTEINSTFKTSYNENYISTIWKKKILEAIAQVATLQEIELKEVFFEENWKKCSLCGRTLLRDPRYFMRKKTSSDGLGARCKKCEKDKREQRKKENLRAAATN